MNIIIKRVFSFILLVITLTCVNVYAEEFSVTAEIIVLYNLNDGVSSLG